MSGIDSHGFYYVSDSYGSAILHVNVCNNWLKKDRTRTANIEIPGYTIEHTPTEAYCGGTLLYIKDSLKYVCRNNLQIYKAGELESTVVELFSSSGKHIIVGCIYRHPSMNLSEFDSSYLNDLLEELSHKNKKIF